MREVIQTHIYSATTGLPKWGNAQPQVKALVFHTDQGNFYGTLQELRGPRSASYHRYYRKNGEIHEFVPLDKIAWHAGVINQPIEEAVQLFGLEQTNRPDDPDGWEPNINGYTWGLCYEGKNQYANDAQVESCAWDIINNMNPDLPFFSHIDVTSYKPPQVRDFQNRVVQKIKEMQNGCTLSQFSTSEIGREYLRRIRASLIGN